MELFSADATLYLYYTYYLDSCPWKHKNAQIFLVLQADPNLAQISISVIDNDFATDALVQKDFIRICKKK